MRLILFMCSLTCCSSVLCVNDSEYVYICKCYVFLDDVPSLFVFPACAYGGVIWYFRWELSFLYCDDVACYMRSVLVPRFCIDAVYVNL